ncbi:Ion channel [compost metagenome]
MNLVFAIVYLFTGIEHHGSTEVRRYFQFSPGEWKETLSDFALCVYFSFATSLTAGYGELHPTNLVNQIASNIHALLGFVLLTLFTISLVRRWVIE